jgi:hypothetical protein
MTKRNRALRHNRSRKQGVEANEPASGRLRTPSLTSSWRQQIAGLQPSEWLMQRKSINRSLLLITALNCLIFLAWFWLRSTGIKDRQIVFGLLALTILTWAGLLAALIFRLRFWLKHERKS